MKSETKKHGGVIRIHATHILYRAFQEPEFDEKYSVETFAEKQTCALCGQSIEKGVSTSKIFKTNFTNHDYFDPAASHVCPACAFPFTEQTFRRTSFVTTTAKFIPIKRPELADWLFNPPLEPFAFCITTTFKKHLVFRAKANTNPKRYYIQFDDSGVIFEPYKLKTLFETLTELYVIFSKTEILSGNYYPFRIKQFGLNKLMQTEQEVKKHRGSVSFRLLVHALNREENTQNDAAAEKATII